MEIYIQQSPYPNARDNEQVRRSVCSAVLWLSDGSLLSAHEDGTLWLWSATGELLTELLRINTSLAADENTLPKPTPKRSSGTNLDGTIRQAETRDGGTRRIVHLISTSTTKRGVISGSGVGTANTPGISGSSQPVNTTHATSRGIPSPKSSTSHSSGSGSLLLHDTVLAGGSDGSLLFIHLGNRRIEKIIDNAHRGCITFMAFHPDYTCFVTCGEDGALKLWSPAGIQRAVLVQPVNASSTAASPNGLSGPSSSQITNSAPIPIPILAVAWCVDLYSTGSSSKRGRTGPDAQSNSGGVKAGATTVRSVEGGSSSHLLFYAQGSFLFQRGTQPGTTSRRHPKQWKAHEGLVLSMDCANDLVVTGGEDGMYRVWDVYGRLLYGVAPTPSSISSDTEPITSVRFSPDVQYIAVGSFDQIRICDRMGWTHCRKRAPGVGSLYSMAWMSDGTQLAAGSSTGTVLFTQIVNFRATWKNIVCRVQEPTKVEVVDVNASTPNTASEWLNVRDRIVRLHMAYDHLIVLTTTQCHVYTLQSNNKLHASSGNSVASLSISAPILIDVKACIHRLCMCSTGFSILDSQGVQFYGYDGRSQMSLRVHAQLVSISPDVVVVVEAEDPRRALFFESRTGRSMKNVSIVHDCEITDVALNQFTSTGSDMNQSLEHRMLAFRDINGDAFLFPVSIDSSAISSKTNQTPHSNEPTKILSMVSTLCWHETVDVLLLISDRKLTVSYCPAAIFVDRDLSSLTRRGTSAAHQFSAGSNGAIGAASISSGYADGQNHMHDFERSDTILDFVGDTYTVRRGNDGAHLIFHVPSPYPRVLYSHIRTRQWGSAVRVCRIAREPFLWCILAVHAIRARQLEMAEDAYAALEDIAKVRMMQYIRSLNSSEHQYAELALFQHRPDEAERILLSAGLIYRAIRMNIRLFNWERALEIATERRTHVDTVLAFRQKYLDAFGKPETHEKFQHYFNSGIKIDPEVINTKIKEEKEREKSHARGSTAANSNMLNSSPTTTTLTSSSSLAAATTKVTNQTSASAATPKVSTGSVNPVTKPSSSGPTSTVKAVASSSRLTKK